MLLRVFLFLSGCKKSKNVGLNEASPPEVTVCLKQIPYQLPDLLDQTGS
jgi:hypothetical protein